MQINAAAFVRVDFGGRADDAKPDTKGYIRTHVGSTLARRHRYYGLAVFSGCPGLLIFALRGST